MRTLDDLMVQLDHGFEQELVISAEERASVSELAEKKCEKTKDGDEARDDQCWTCIGSWFDPRIACKPCKAKRVLYYADTPYLIQQEEKEGKHFLVEQESVQHSYAKLMTRCRRYREALEAIASCTSNTPDDVVSVARRALHPPPPSSGDPNALVKWEP